jgi:amino acid adenylation domain-containing protein
VDGPFPLTELQEAYLVGTSDGIELGGFRPNFYFELDMAGLDPARAEAAVDQLIRRHEQLRTVLLPDGGQQALRPDQVPPFPIPISDLRGRAPDRQEEGLRATREQMLEDGPDPFRWPMFRIAVTRIRSHRCRVHVAMSLLLADAHSVWLLISEWLELVRDPAAAQARPRLTFRDCVRAIAQDQDSPGFAAHWDYWEARLDSLGPAPALPLARPVAGLSRVRFVRRSCRLSAAEWTRFRANCRQHRLMPSAALAHVYAETLGAWAAHPRFCLNVLHLGWLQRHPEWTGVVGQLGATLPLEVDLSLDDGFWDRGQRLQGQLWRDLEHCDVTAVRVMREVAARRGWTSRAALPCVFNSMLGLGAPRSGRPTGRIAASGLRTPHVLIDNQVQDTPDQGIECVWDTVDDAFPAGLPADMFSAYQSMLRELAAPDGAWAQPDPVPLRYRDVVAVINRPTGPPPAGRLEAGFARQAAARPGATALITGRRTVSYGELDALSRAVAGWLQARGTGRGDVVAVVMVKGWEQVAAVLGVLRAGAAYCPVDASLPAMRIRQLLGQCRAAAVLTQSHAGPASGPDPGVPVLAVDQITGGAPRLASHGGVQEDLAYVIYTSGSTGSPKGVMIEHRSALNTIADINTRLGLGRGDRVFGVSSLSFDLSVWDIFGTLAAGAALVLPESGDPDPARWSAAAAAHAVTVWNSVPAIAEMLAEATEHGPAAVRPPVRAFLLSGDWIPTSLPGRVRRLWPAARLLALGGATEAAIWSNGLEIETVDPAWPSIPYGKPLTGQTIRVLDHRLAVRAPWAEGRIYIGGAGLARGYLGDQDRTAERFIRHPGTGERLYWTGDLGRYWPDGTIELLGREDRQLKIQGFRVEPGEVEAAIRAEPGVRACAVGAETAAAGQRRLVALAVPEQGVRLEGTAILAALRDRLPHYLVPARIEVVRELPLTPNGKLDMAGALASVSAAAGPAQGHGAGPGSELVPVLARLWAEVLQLPGAGPDSDFFALGGTSLLALRLVNRVRAELGSDLSLGRLFELPTPAALGRALADGQVARGAALPLAGGDGQELVLFHPVGGSVGVYGELARAWPGPVRAFQSPALADTTGPVTVPSLTAMAAGYRAEVQRLAPAGPYVLGGWSLGGVLAYEVAHQLPAEARQACVVMIDSQLGRTGGRRAAADMQLAFLADLAGGRLPDGVAAEIGAAPPRAAPRASWSAAIRYGLLPDDVDLAGYQRLARVHAANLTALARYEPGQVRVPVLLLTARDSAGHESAARWRAVCPQIEIEIWPGDHYTILAGARQAEIAARMAEWAGQRLTRS